MTPEERRKMRLERARNKIETVKPAPVPPEARPPPSVEGQINKPVPLTRPREVRVRAKEARPRARVTIIERAYYETFDQTPTGAFDTGFSRPVSGGGQAYGPRYFALGPEWEALDLGWIESAGMVFIRNHDKALTVEISFSSGDPIVAHQLIPPEEGLRLNPVDPKSLRVRSSTKSPVKSMKLLTESPTESCRCSVVVFPG